MTVIGRDQMPDLLKDIAKRRMAKQGWKAIAFDYGVTVSALHKARQRYAAEAKVKAKSEAKVKSERSEEGKPPIVPELFLENGIVVKRFPPMYAEGTGFGATARPRARQKRND